MTTSRIVRGTKARIFLYISASLIIIALIACYNNTLTQLEDVRKLNEVCHQQEENLSIQLQVITDYKQRLEKSLKTEKAEHQQTKNELENKLNDERLKNDKNSKDLNLRFTSLQQHFNILQTQHDDFKEECSKTQNKQLNEINDLEAKLREVQEELKKIEGTKESLKTQYLQIQSEKEQLERQLKTNQNTFNDGESRINHLTKTNHELQRKINELEEKCSAHESLQAPNLQSSSLSPHNVASSSSKKTNVVLLAPKVTNSTTNTTKSTTAASKQDSFNIVQPIVSPSATPKSVKTPLDGDVNKKIPEGVVPVVDHPSKTNDNKDDKEKTVDIGNEPINNRYRNKINVGAKNEIYDNDNNSNNRKEEEVILDENAGNEMDGDSLNFANFNQQLKNFEKEAINRQHINVDNNNNNKAYDDQQLENEIDDDAGDYDHLDKNNEPAVRH